MKNITLTFRALVSAFLLGVGLSAYAGRLDPVSQHIMTQAPAGSGAFNPAMACSLPCVTPH
jgi:hypothetical protein